MMGQYVFRLPDVGEGIAEAEIVKWHVGIGEAVREEQPLVDIMTDKATVEVAAPVSGIVRRRRGEEGSKLAVGAELAVIETEGAANAQPQVEKPPKVVGQQQPAPRPEPPGKVFAAPAVRARAMALGIDLSVVAGRGPQGQVIHADLDELLVSRGARSTLPTSIPPPEDDAEDIKIFGLRRRIAERMQESSRRIPHFTYVEEVNVQGLEDLRENLNAGRGAKPHLTILPFLIRALVGAIARHPVVNSHFDDMSGVVRRYRPVHAGIATQTERGLLVPVIRHAERMDLWQLSAEIARLSEEARAGKSKREELSGSTITVTSLGALGGLMATPIINAPETAIVGVNRIAQRPVVVDGSITIRKMMNLSSSFDHRIIDGYEAAAFIANVCERLQAPQALVESH